MEVVRDQLGLDTKHCEIGLEVQVEGLEASSESKSPRWGETNASIPRHAESALEFRTGGHDRQPASTGSGSAVGTYPRDRRIGKAVRTTESSQRRWIGRSCARNKSAIPPSLSRASSSSSRLVRPSGSRSSSPAGRENLSAADGGVGCMEASPQARKSRAPRTEQLERPRGGDEDDRPCRDGSSSSSACSISTKSVGDSRHQGEGLVLAVLAHA